MPFTWSPSTAGLSPGLYFLVNFFLWKAQHHSLLSGKCRYLLLTESEDAKPPMPKSPIIRQGTPYWISSTCRQKGTECFHCRALSCFLFGFRLELSSRLPPGLSLSLLLSFSSSSHFLSFSKKKKKKKKKKKSFKHERLTFFISWSVDRNRSVDRFCQVKGRARYCGPLCGNLMTVQKRCEKIALWTGPWTAKGDGPLTPV